MAILMGTVLSESGNAESGQEQHPVERGHDMMYATVHNFESNQNIQYQVLQPWSASLYPMSNPESPGKSLNMGFTGGLIHPGREWSSVDCVQYHQQMCRSDIEQIHD